VILMMLQAVGKNAGVSTFEWVTLLLGSGLFIGMMKAVALLMEISVKLGEFKERFVTVEKETGSQGQMLQQQGNLLSKIVGFLQGKGFTNGGK